MRVEAHPLRCSSFASLAPLGIAAGLLGIVSCGLAHAASLTLEDALAGVEQHPVVAAARADLDAARAGVSAVAAEEDWQVGLRARARWIGPAEVAADQGSDDHKLALLASRPLYEFGRDDARRAAAEAGARSRQSAVLDTRDQQRLEVMHRYFDVLLADLAFAVQNERMAIDFIRWDRVRERNELGEISDVELYRLDAAYQARLVKRSAAQQRQRLSRARLAEAMGSPDELPDTLVEPAAVPADRELPEYGELLQRALAGNRLLLARRERVEVALQQLQLARAGGRPRLEAQAEMAAYSREEGGSDRWRLGVLLSVPLYQGDRLPAARAAARARLQRERAALADEEARLRATLLELWQQIRLFAARREAAARQMDYRELYLDRSRIRYEMELGSDLGDAMSEFSRARLESAEVRYGLILAWAQLEALLGDVAAAPPAE